MQQCAKILLNNQKYKFWDTWNEENRKWRKV